MAIEPLPAYDDETEEERFLREQAQAQALATLQGGVPSPDSPDRAAPPVPNPGGVPAAGPVGPRPSVFRDPEPPAQAAGPIARGPLPRPTPAQAPTPTPTAPEAGDDAGYQRARRAQLIQELIGAATGIGTAVATGGRATAGEVPANALANFQAQRAARQQGQAQRAATGRQEEELGLRRRQVELAERRGESQEALAQSRLRREDVATEAAEGEAGLARSLRDPESVESERARSTYERLAGEFGIENIGELIGGRSAYDLRNDPALEQLTAAAVRRELINIQGQFTKYGRASRLRGGGGGRGGAGQSRDEMEQLYVDQTRELGGNADLAQRTAGILGTRTLRTEIANQQEQLFKTNTLGVRTEREAAQAIVPGYQRTEGAPLLSAPEQREARRDVSIINNVRDNTQEMVRLAGELSTIERAGGAVGAMTPQMAQARALGESITNDLRVIGNYGVPQAAELERMRGIAPDMDSVQGILSGVNQYRALGQVLTERANRDLAAVGYVPDTGGAGSAQHQRGGNARSVTLYNADGESREFPLTTQGRDRARRDGFTRRAPP